MNEPRSGCLERESSVAGWKGGALARGQREEGAIRERAVRVKP
jgi:hypothetical protein